MEETLKRSRRTLEYPMAIRTMLLFVALTCGGCAASAKNELLDTPLKIASISEATNVLKEIRDSLDSEASFFFTIGFERLDVEYTRHISHELKKEEREAAFISVVDGMTPRQIMLVGVAFYVRQSQEGGSEEIPVVEKNNGPLGDPESIAVDAIRRFGNRKQTKVQRASGRAKASR